jgi:hypothetical protein
MLFFFLKKLKNYSIQILKLFFNLKLNQIYIIFLIKECIRNCKKCIDKYNCIECVEKMFFNVSIFECICQSKTFL